MGHSPVVVWLRRDLRTSDNPPLFEAAQQGRPVVPLYILDDGHPWAPGAAARWWLDQSLRSLGDRFASLGSPLILRRGDALGVLRAVAEECGADTVWWNHAGEWIEQDEEIAAGLAERGIATRRFEGTLLVPPTQLRTGQGGFYRVFTPFWNALRQLGEPARPLPAPERLTPPAQALASDDLDDWHLRPSHPDWSGGIAEAWIVGEAAGQKRLADFVDQDLQQYAGMRDRPDQPGTSRLSPHLAWGEVSPRQVWHAAAGRDVAAADHFLRELGWREFSHHLLFHCPQLPDQPLRAEFAAFPWDGTPEIFAAWKKGRTGYPIVDAGMRQLWRIGWMHNRVRMIVASFLVKDLLIDWRTGQAWFWDTLVDADLACNAGNWQWVAGCGTDAAPYFRVFNPVVQGEKFDPRGRYVRRWVPELAGLSDMFIHRPSEASAEVLAKAGIILGEGYARPVVEHGAARRRALSAYEQVRNRDAYGT